MNYETHNEDKGDSHKPDRLPCRGCTDNCSDYYRCNGKPWRLTDNKNNSGINKT